MHHGQAKAAAMRNVPLFPLPHFRRVAGRQPLSFNKEPFLAPLWFHCPCSTVQSQVTVNTCLKITCMGSRHYLSYSLLRIPVIASASWLYFSYLRRKEHAYTFSWHPSYLFYLSWQVRHQCRPLSFIRNCTHSTGLFHVENTHTKSLHFFICTH